MTIRTIAPVGCSSAPSALGCAGCSRAASCATTLGCSGCPCSSRCAAKGLSGLGCPCNTCASRATCPRSQALGRALGDITLPSIDFSSLSTWIMIALAVLLGYQLFFSKDKRAKRAARTKDLRGARERYYDQVAKIREQYA